MAEPVVRIKQGELKGKIVAYENTKYYSFRGIPYAKPPVGDLRFKAPQPPDPWHGVFDATKEGNECCQRDPYFGDIRGSEDCLVLNVYTPELPKNHMGALKPVMVWIHGGSFASGSCRQNLYGPDFLIREGVVVVSINYRLGIFGYLSFEDPSLGVPGNAGFKDAVMALRWVQNNIEHFMGDPNNVTIFGESCGAIFVHFLILSPMCKGLFHKAIMQSGNALQYWSMGINFSRELAECLGINCEDEATILKNLRQLPASEILKAQEMFNDPVFQVCIPTKFSAVIEKASNKAAFLSEDPLDIIKSGNYNKVPMIVGYNSREGMLISVLEKFYHRKPTIITNFEKAIPHKYKLQAGSKESKLVAEKIKEFYYGSEEPSNENIDRYYMLQTDIIFLKDIYDMLRNHIVNNEAPIYFYRFSLETRLNLFKIIGGIKAPGVCHSDELGYLFKMSLNDYVQPGSVEDTYIRIFTKLWTTFAHHGNPNLKENRSLMDIEWKPIEVNNFHFLDIDKTLTVGVNPDIERVIFWDEIVKFKNELVCDKQIDNL